MKTIYSITFAAVVTFGAQALYNTPIAQAASQTWTGQISSSNCGLTHAPGMKAGDCTRQCVDQGATYVLVSNSKMYTFANQKDKQLRTSAGETVTVTGDLKGDVITVSKIEGATSSVPDR